MIRLPLPAIAIAAVFLVSCAAKHPPPAAVQPPPAGSQPSALARQSTAAKIADGAVTQISSGHGNAYTSIGPDQYVVLGLEPGSATGLGPVRRHARPGDDPGAARAGRPGLGRERRPVHRRPGDPALLFDLAGQVVQPGGVMAGHAARDCR